MANPQTFDGHERPVICVGCEKEITEEELADCVSWIPYGHSYMLEPPDGEFMHGACWDALPDDRRKFIEDNVWQGPVRLDYRPYV